MDLQKIESAVLARYEEAGYPKTAPLTREQLWVGMRLSHNGEKPMHSREILGLSHYAIDPFESPWIDELKQLKPDTAKPRVLVYGRMGTNTDLVKKGLVSRACEELGLTDYVIVYCNGCDTFWLNFFGTDQYLTDPKDIPALIVSPGFSRIELDSGMHHQVSVKEQLQEVHERWNVPVVIVNLRDR